MCRAMSVVWTNPLVATLGMSLTIPLAMLADMIVHGRHYSFIYILGSAQVWLADVALCSATVILVSCPCVAHAYHSTCVC